ncbi:hypothetical protein [Leptospira terpstrae]|uniref:Uncharacterized protein n=1 Tax=Leptospira terpstrae serovar Hualin str. LT 11-33 = ATCC 700639 TaxID=1257025 RepID=N1VKQ9_9LEPT|nr:hypothetical protein [Leptospira terpstrae]EMY60294.1 hypothetical protein LEP1GSC203_0745 [Leptospira terpstrae serovar Hualin str. LT 11-33 = ATCC 700639]
MKNNKIYIILSAITVLLNCKGTYTYYYIYPEIYNTGSKGIIKKKSKIAIYLNDKDNDINKSVNLTHFKSTLEKPGFNIYTVKNANEFKSFDLIIMNYYSQKDKSVFQTFEKILRFYTYSNMIITFGILSGHSYTRLFHTIEIYKPASDKHSQISYTEYSVAKDGWIANYEGRTKGNFDQDYNRYYIKQVEDEDHQNKQLDILLLEASRI